MTAIPKELLKRLAAVSPREVTIGFGGLELFAPSSVAAEQVGYAHSPAGEDLCGGRQGAWKRPWVVFGHETLCGDPLFVDTDDARLPVYTAVHAEGAWQPDLVADSFDAFVATLHEISRLSRGRADSALEDNPLSRSERKSLTKILHGLSPQAKPNFWLALFDVE